MRVRGEGIQEVDKLNYLGLMISTDDAMEEEMAHWVLERRKVWGTLAEL